MYVHCINFYMFKNVYINVSEICILYIVTCWVLHATKMTGSNSDDWIY
jgi:hypothetical protein